MATKTRDVISQTLHKKGKCTIQELAHAASISPLSVRHHITNLNIQGLIAIEDARHGVGRPYYLHSLADLAAKRYPTRYVRLTQRILKQMKDTLPKEYFLKVLSRVAASMVSSFNNRNPKIHEKDFRGYLPRLVQFLSEEGFEAQIE